MNMKRILGFGAMLLGLLIPFQSAYLSVGEMNNILGLVSFVACIALLFIGYALVDRSYPKPEATNAEDQH
jgi:hypothetical protein